MNSIAHIGFCPGTQPYVRDQWYVIAFAHEVEQGKPLARRVMDEPIVIYRTADNQVTALYDRCPHRAVPLSQGRVLANTIECPYHGFQFDRSGKCVLIPTQELIPAAACTRSYPVHEAMQFVWIWMGDPARADTSMIPTYEQLGCGQGEWQFAPYFMMEIKCNYSLLFENLLDTSHISFLHIGGIDSGKMATSPFTVSTNENVVTLERNLVRDEAIGGTAKLFSLTEGQVFSRLLNTRSFLPNLHVVTNTIGFPDEPGRAPRVRLNIIPITPVSMGHVYQFVTVVTSYPIEVTQGMKDQLWGVFTQDLEALEAIQAGYDEQGPDTREISVRADAAALSARRGLAKMTSAASPRISVGTAIS